MAESSRNLLACCGVATLLGPVCDGSLVQHLFVTTVNERGVPVASMLLLLGCLPVVTYLGPLRDIRQGGRFQGHRV